MTEPARPEPQSFLLDPFEYQADVGDAPRPGICTYDPDRQSFTITSSGVEAAGAEAALDRDAFHYVLRRMRGDFIVTARAEFLGGGKNAGGKLGWMARSSLESGAPQASACILGDGTPVLEFRRDPGGQREALRMLAQGADVIQLERRGDRFILSAARFGEPFATIVSGDGEIRLGEEVYLGLFVTQGQGGAGEGARFENVRIVAPVQAGFNRESDPFASRLEILDVESGLREIVYNNREVIEAPNWTRDAKALIYNSRGRLYRFDLESRTHEEINTGSVVRNNNDHVLSFDGSMLAISSHTGEHFDSMVYTVPLGGGQPRQITPVGPSYLHGWSPDGKYLVYTALRSGDYDIFRAPAEGGPEERLTTAPGLDDGPEYTPDGRYIYFNSVRSGSMQIWRMKPDGSEQEQLTADECNNWFPHVSPDGKTVIFVSYLPGEVEPSDHPAAKHVYLRTMPIDGGTPRVVAYLYGGQGTMNVPSWSPDGKKVAFISNTVPF